MSHFIYPSGTPLGTVPFGYVVPSSEWQLTIRQVFRALNGDEGGSWAPASFIVVGGSGFSLTGTGHQIAGSARLTVQNTGEIRLNNGSVLRADGTSGDILLKVSSSIAILEVESGAVFQVDTGGAFDLFGQLTVKQAGAGNVTWEEDATATFLDGSVITIQAGALAWVYGQEKVGDGGQILMLDGSAMNFVSGSNLTGASGAQFAWGGTLAVSGELTFVGSSNWPKMTMRSIYRSKFSLIPLTFIHDGTSDTDSPSIMWTQSLSTNAPAALTRPATDLIPPQSSILRLEDLPIGGDLISVKVKTIGSVSPGTLVRPTYEIVSWEDSSSDGVTSHSSAVTDAHASDGSNWTNSYVETTITVSGGGVEVDGQRQYGVRVTHPTGTGANGTQMTINRVLSRTDTDILRF